MDWPFIRYQYIGSKYLHFVTMHSLKNIALCDHLHVKNGAVIRYESMSICAVSGTQVVNSVMVTHQ